MSGPQGCDPERLCELRAALESVTATNVAVVDAWGVLYFDRLDLAELLNVYRLIRRASDVARPRIVAPAGLRRLLEGSGFERLFDIYDDLDCALRAVKSHN